MRTHHDNGSPDSPPPCGPPEDCFAEYPYPALRLDAAGRIVAANAAARRRAAGHAVGLSGLLPFRHAEFTADALRLGPDDFLPCPPDPAAALQWTYRAAGDLCGVAMFAAEVAPAERRLRVRETLLRRFIEHVPAAAAMFDADLRYLLASRRWHVEFDFLPERLEGLRHYDLIDVPEAWKERHRRALAGEDVPPTEVSFVRPDTGRTEWVLTQILPWMRDDGEIGGVLIFNEVITARKEAEEGARRRLAEERRRRKMESLGTLANGIAHEINSPIQYIADNLGFLHDVVADLTGLIRSYRGALSQATMPCVLCEQIAADEKAMDLAFLEREGLDAVRQAQAGIAAINRIVTAIRTFAQPGHADPTPVDVNRVIRDAILVSHNQWQEVADLADDLDDAQPIVIGHGDQLGQAVLNMIVNAVHAIEEAGRGRGRIRIVSRAGANGVEIRIEDNGIGIPPDRLERVFEPYFTTKP